MKGIILDIVGGTAVGMGTHQATEGVDPTVQLICSTLSSIITVVILFIRQNRKKRNDKQD